MKGRKPRRRRGTKSRPFPLIPRVPLGSGAAGVGACLARGFREGA